MTKKIFLTQNKFTLVDDEDYKYLNQFKWYARKDGNTYYALRSEYLGYGKQRTILMHRELLKPDKNQQIDHIDHNGLNNTKNNLRIVNHRINSQNHKSKKYSSKYPGVDFHKGPQKWRANIWINGKKIHIGYFETEEEAYKAYLKKANKQ